MYELKVGDCINYSYDLHNNIAVIVNLRSSTNGDYITFLFLIAGKIISREFYHDNQCNQLI